MPPRDRCYDCFRPTEHCLCRWIEPVDNRTGILVLQHPKERGHAFNTVRLARLALMAPSGRCIRAGSTKLQPAEAMEATVQQLLERLAAVETVVQQERGARPSSCARAHGDRRLCRPRAASRRRVQRSGQRRRGDRVRGEDADARAHGHAVCEHAHERVPHIAPVWPQPSGRLRACQFFVDYTQYLVCSCVLSLISSLV